MTETAHEHEWLFYLGEEDEWPLFPIYQCNLS